MKGVLRWALSTAILLLVLGVCFRGAICHDDAVTWAKRTITGQNKGVLGDIFRSPEINLPDLELPAPAEEITGAGRGTGAVTLPEDSVGGVVGGPIHRPARDVEVDLRLYRLDGRVVPDLRLDGIRVPLENWEYEEVSEESAWARWRVVVPSVADDGEVGGGLAWAALNRRVWAGPAATVDLPDLEWAAVGAKAGYHLTDNASFDLGGEYRLGPVRPGTHLTAGFSISL
jgi:hypothetical protein